MRVFRWRTTFLLGGVAVAAASLFASSSSALASSGSTCTGDLSNVPASLGTLAGVYSGNVDVTGDCAVDAGPATINGNLTLEPGSALVAPFSFGDLTVTGNLLIKQGAAAILGCNHDSFPCFDDAGDPPTLDNSISVGGNLIANKPLGLVLHNTAIHGNAIENGGGGGVTCDSSPGIFGAFGSPPYIDQEDGSVGGNLIMQGMGTCWLGTLRVDVGGNLIVGQNATADPDAMEVVSNTVHGNIICRNNSPNVQFGDSGGVSNEVFGNAIGECGFNVLSDNPFGSPSGPTPISVKAG
jgi:hypothetical protein